MARWAPAAKERLAAAALDLYLEQGYEQTTVAEVAARAGLTERTFFRHFADKREVLFAGAEALEQLLVAAVEDAPPPSSPLGAVTSALEASGPMFDDRREFARKRQTVIAATPELLERELIKLARLASAIASALRRRGVDAPVASLAAETGLAIFRVAFERWVDGATPFAGVIVSTAAELERVTTGA